MILLDTDHLSVVINSRSPAHADLIARLEHTPESYAVPVICVEEQCKGWLAKIHRLRSVHEQIGAYENLKLLFHFFRKWGIASLDSAAAHVFDQLRKKKIRIGSQDLKIAAIALSMDALLLSANLRDFRKIPGLRWRVGLGNRNSAFPDWHKLPGLE
jgi:tRNA(fMet)-specific endonuclease VapC